MYGEVTYVSRTEYSDRTVMLETHASALQARKPQAKVSFPLTPGSQTRLPGRRMCISTVWVDLHSCRVHGILCLSHASCILVTCLLAQRASWLAPTQHATIRRSADDGSFTRCPISQMCGALQIHVIAEGAAEPLALLGLVRLVDYLAACSRLPPYQPHSIIVDSGTGTTATGNGI